MDNVNKKIDLNKDEQTFVDALLSELSRHHINGVIIERLYDDSLCFTYNNFTIGKIKLSTKPRWMQITNENTVDLIKKIKIDQAIHNLDKWVSYAILCSGKEEITKQGDSIVVTSVDNGTDKAKDNVVKCPKCSSVSITTTNKKVSLKRAIVGTALLNPVAGAIGAVTSKKMYCICTNCGYKWEIGK